MADSYIDKFETILYGRFAASQILGLVVGLDAELAPAVTIVANRITKATDVMEAALEKAGEIGVVTYAAAGESADDPVSTARRVLRQAIAYAKSRDNGSTIASDMLNGGNLSTLLKRRPTKLAGALGDAIKGVEKHKASLPEHTDWVAKLGAAQSALEGLNQSVRKARTERRAMTPEIAGAREAWLVVYLSAKSIVEGVLRGAGKLALMPEVFDDLAEVHRVAGVTDDATAPAAGEDAPADPA